MSMNIEELAELIDGAIAEGQLPYLIYTLLMSVLLSFAILVAFFVLKAIGLYRINRRLGNRFAWLAFIPGLSGYALGAAADGLKKRKPSNYCIHMLMLELFYFVVNVVYYVKTAQRFFLLYEGLRYGSELGTLELIESTLTVDKSDMLFFLSYYVMTFLNYAVTLVSLLCFTRILLLFRTSRGGFLLIMASVFVPQVMYVYLFVMRNKRLYTEMPAFSMPNGPDFGQGFGEGSGGSGAPNDFYDDSPSEEHESDPDIDDAASGFSGEDDPRNDASQSAASNGNGTAEEFGSEEDQNRDTDPDSSTDGDENHGEPQA